ncbi:unnamed protein product [Candida parapsilosis]
MLKTGFLVPNTAFVEHTQ